MVGPPAGHIVRLAAFYLEIKSWRLTMRWKELLAIIGLLIFVSAPFIWSAIVKFIKKSKKT